VRLRLRLEAPHLRRGLKGAGVKGRVSTQEELWINGGVGRKLVRMALSRAALFHYKAEDAVLSNS
jgi:hypothetical protein